MDKASNGLARAAKRAQAFSGRTFREQAAKDKKKGFVGSAIGAAAATFEGAKDMAVRAVGGSSFKRGQEGAQNGDVKALVARKGTPAPKKHAAGRAGGGKRRKIATRTKPPVAATELTGMGAAVYFYIDASGIVTHPGKDDDLFGNDLDTAPLERTPPAVSPSRLPASVRLRGLVLVLLLLLWGSTPLFDLPSGTSRCVLTASVSTHQTRSRVDYSLEERDYLIRTVAFEAAHEPEQGRAAVAHVILNRKQSAKWADSIKAVVTQPWQFEPWMTRRQEVENLSADDPRYQNAAKVVDAVLAGQISDPTAGATHFLNAMLVRERNGGSLPSWAQGDGLSIGRHTFYAAAIRNSSSDTSPFSKIVSAIFFAGPQRSC